MMFKVPSHCNLDTTNNNWLITVSGLDKIDYPDNNHAYILPDNSVWVLSYDGKKFINITDDSSKNCIIPDGSLTREQTNYLEPILINSIGEISVGSYYPHDTGNRVIDPNRATTGLIYVSPGQKFKIKDTGIGDSSNVADVYFWKSNFSKLKGFLVDGDILVPENAGIMRIGIATESVEKVKLYNVDDIKYTDRLLTINTNQISDYESPACKLSICGDSISTFEGSLPEGNKTYYPANDVVSINDTYWGKLLNNKFSLKLLVNNSWSGSWVSTGKGNGAPGSSGTNACKFLNIGNNDPDVIILYKGTNDFSGNVSLSDFEKEYKLFVDNTKVRFKKAKIYVFNILFRSQLPINNNGNTVGEFNSIIKKIADENEVTLIDIYNCGINSENSSDYLIDGIHPNKKGHELMYQEAKKQIYDYI